jgi:ABC-type transporter Mla subunit MlaD
VSQETNHFKLGLFVLLALGAIVAGVAVLGAGGIFRTSVAMETYLDQSVQGLDVGAPVRFRGVQVGSVKEIGFVRREYETRAPLVMIKMAIDPARVGLNVADDIQKPEGLKEEIAQGLRVRMASQGLTGSAYLEVDYLDPADHPPLDIDWAPRTPYLPSAPSTVVRMTDALERVLGALGRSNVDVLVHDVRKLVDRITVVVESDLAAAAKELANAGPRLRELLANANRLIEGSLSRALKQIESAAEGVPSAVAEIQSTATQARRSLRRLERLAAGEGENLERTLENVRALSEDLRELGETGKRYPSGVLFGDKPAPVEMEKK